VTFDVVATVLAAFGAAVGFAADALAHRWPMHEEDHTPRSRFDWRTVALVMAGAISFGLLGARFGHDAQALVVYVLLFVALLVLLATDLDQRLLPDVVTLPLIVFAAAVLFLGVSPALEGKSLGMISGLAAGFGFPVVLFVTDRIFRGGLGQGDLKLAVSLGFLFGLSAFFYGLLLASIGVSIVLVALMVARRLTMKSFIPFGPILIFAAFIAALWV
jgi:leader peptidase (prepilin peptidase)/N-methyltransferase